MHDQVINIRDLKFSWPDSESETLQVKRLTVYRGDTLFIKGRSGCGKTTLLNLLSGISVAKKGMVKVLGKDLSQLSVQQRDCFRADHIGIIFQQFNLLPYLSLQENIALSCFFSSHRRQKESSVSQAITQWLNALKIPVSLFKRPVSQLSVGQQQRVAAAKALIGHPELIIADEATSALDIDNRNIFLDALLNHVRNNQGTLVFVSHDLSIASRFSRILSL